MIAKTFTDSFAEVQKLSADFHKHIDEYLKPKYQEAEVRQDFLDKFFVALGWDVYHHENQNPYEREVKIEKSVMVQGRGKRADYAFYTAPNFTQAKFMAEAKKPSKQLENAQDCFQAIRYGWNSNTPISVLTDFEQFFVLDSRYKPTIETATQRIIKEKSFTYLDFADEEKFKELYYLFSREAVINNSLETFAKSLKGGRGAKQSKLFNTSIIQPMDEEFLSELDEQRVVLAKAFKNRNSDLDGETLTEITQRTLDRLVFLRFLEDKLVEPDSVIDNLGKKSGSAWRDFIGEMPRLNSIYNGTLFRSHAILDNPNFAPESRSFEQTRDWLSHFNSPYDFNSIPIHILGSIYERFLGKTIVATDKRATVEDKPEVRKAGGVYYTPEYIVRYIVENTIGRLLDGGNPRVSNGGNPRVSKGAKTVSDENTLTNVRVSAKKKTSEEIAEMRFADIACGSGSFLLGVFDYLIAYHVEWFSENKTRREKAIKDGLCRETIEGVLQLSISYKREILLNNIYGVDLDAQAVEVAQLSLYLKLLEEETTATKQQFLAGFREQLLPSLNKNIVHGNSLIDYDIMDGMLFDTRELKQLNPMNFQSTFPEVFQKGGFDAIVGNPPYSYMINSVQQEYFSHKFKHQNYQKDLYLLFLERYENVLKQGGLLGVIVSNTWLQSLTMRSIRKYLSETYNWIKFLHLPEKVFNAVVDTHVLVFQLKGDLASNDEILIDIRKNEGISLLHSFPTEMIASDGEIINIVTSHEAQLLFRKIQNKSVAISEVCDVFNGIKPFEKGKGKPPQTSQIMKEKPYVVEGAKPSEEFLPLLRGSLIRRYENLWNANYWVLYGEWLAAPRNPEIFSAPKKLMIRQTGDSLIATEIESGFIARNNLHILITKQENSNNNFPQYQLRFVLGMLNSKLGNFVYSIINPEKGEALAEVKKAHVEMLNFYPIDFSQPKEKAAHDKIVELVEKMLEAKKQLSAAQTDKDKTFYERFCSSLDTQIDDLVYDLYDLTTDERTIIKSA